MKTLYIALLGAMLVLFPQLSYSYEIQYKDSDANIVGHVIDKHTKEHLPYITVRLKGTTIGPQRMRPATSILSIFRKEISQ